MTAWSLKMTSDDDFQGSGVDYTGSAWTLTGTLKKGEAEAQLAVTFKQSFPDWNSSYTYTGTIYPDRNIMKGTFISDDDEEITGTFFFLLTPNPISMCHRPLKLKLTIQERWSLACKSALDIVQRRQLPSKFLTERLKMCKRMIELGYRDDLSKKETKEFNELKKRYLPSEVLDVYSWLNWFNRVWDQVG
jgi:hypothetical protein